MQAKEVAVTYWATVEVDYIPYEQVWYVALVKIAQNVNKLDHLRQIDIPRWLTILVPTPNKNKINSLSVPHHNQNTLYQPVMYIHLTHESFKIWECRRRRWQ
jgi:hypothetical protein